ncbi:hypothetical protein NE237_007798 [Protea cynaroides]|uniref:Cytochrome P450 n=1 Tax=Protea cynaroides TaxID=273540 RepID=A0A9Q0QWU4_9MAGN|nr:hypothetical protein NE237_007798 [Protea cynaroides]
MVVEVGSVEIGRVRMQYSTREDLLGETVISGKSQAAALVYHRDDLQRVDSFFLMAGHGGGKQTARVKLHRYHQGHEACLWLATYLSSNPISIVSSSSLAKEMLKDHDAIFANHNPPIAALVIAYGGNDILWNPLGPDWRMMRKVLVRDLMSNTSLDACYNLRRQEIQQMMEEKTRIGVEFRKMIGELVILLGKTNISDIFPILAPLDLQGIERKAKVVFTWADTILDSVINERLKMEAGGEKRSKDDLESKDFLEIFLEIKQQEDGKAALSMRQLKALLLDIISAGTDTTTTTLEWAFAEMMQNPNIMRKVQEELGKVVGMSNKVEESHISMLPYLNAVVKETLRLHPAISLLIPHCPSQSCTIGQFTIPKGANVFLNVWKIHRDPEAWEDPSEFLPERFLRDNNGYDYMGNNFNYLPFGSGRRICPGISLAERMSMYMLATLLHSFEWKLLENAELDLSDEFGLMLKKRIPLVITPTPRLSKVELYK